MPVQFDLEEQAQLTENGLPVDNYGTTAAMTNNNNEDNDVTFNSEDCDEDDDSFDLTGGERSFRDSKALPNVLGQIHASNVLLSSRNLVTSTLIGIDRTSSGHFANEDQEHYDSIPSLVEERVALVCDANLHRRDKGGLYYQEAAFYNNQVEPFFVVTVNPFIFQKIMHEVYRSTTVPCGMYFCCQGGDGAHTGVAHEDFVSISMAWALVAVVFTGILVVAALPGDEEWSLNG